MMDRIGAGGLTIGCSGCGAGHISGRNESFARRPRTTDPWGVRRRRNRLLRGALGAANRLERVSIAADASVVRITAALQVATRSGEGMCGAAVSREPLNDQGQVRATPVRISSAARRRHHLRCVLRVQCWGWLAGA
jgi:hypothetical protein